MGTGGNWGPLFKKYMNEEQSGLRNEEQSETISNPESLHLKGKQTDCLAVYESSQPTTGVGAGAKVISPM